MSMRMPPQRFCWFTVAAVVVAAGVTANEATTAGTTAGQHPLVVLEAEVTQLGQPELSTSSSSVQSPEGECDVSTGAEASCLEAASRSPPVANDAHPNTLLAWNDDEEEEPSEGDEYFNEGDLDDDDDDEYLRRIEEKEEWKEILDATEEMGVRQAWEDHPHFTSKLDDDLVYHRQFVADAQHRDFRDKCRNRHALCTGWALQVDGTECDNNVRFMKLECPVACHSCDWLDVKTRCAPNPNETDAFRPGDLDRLFERITTDPILVEQFQPQVLSRPTYADGDTAETATYNVGMWLVLLPNFLTSQEADRMVPVVERSGLAPSKGLRETGTGQAISEVSDARTSWNSFCENECHDDPAHQRMLSRAELLLGLSQGNFEHTQLLRYYPGQYYMRHHDFITGHLNDPMGPRLLTLFVYLSDVIDGGGTDFPELNITVQPQKGAAVLWPSVLNDSPTTDDPRADHEALPVREGVKYGANIWVHQRDFKAAYAKDCVETTTTVTP